MAKKPAPKENSGLIETLEARFAKNMKRHKMIEWDDVAARLAKSKKLAVLAQMEETGGEPDVVGYDKKTGEYIFYDCSAESPAGRRSLCYDRNALNARKEHKPKNDALSMAKDIGIEILTEEEYFFLQTLGDFDAKTSSWLKTEDGLRALGGAIYGDFRYGRTFIGHNGAESYYAARGFRGSVRV